jgi:hypothetical protein
MQRKITPDNLDTYGVSSKKFGSPGQTRTADKVINSHPLYQLSYRGMSEARILLMAKF